MASEQVPPKNQIDLDQLLSGVAQLETADLEQFFGQVALLLAQRKATSFPQAEDQLLQQINQGLSQKIQERYDALRAKLQSETITPQEHQEFLTLIDAVEQADAERLQHLVELSQLRQISLPELMTQLDIHPPVVHG